MDVYHIILIWAIALIISLAGIFNMERQDTIISCFESGGHYYNSECLKEKPEKVEIK